MAKRRVKPPGFERWTWAEIDAGRKMSRGERRARHRWNAIGEGLNWDRRADGTHQAPPQAAPILALILVLMLALGVLAPYGIANSKAGEGGAAVIVFLLLIAAFGLLMLLGGNPIRPATGTPAIAPPISVTSPEAREGGPADPKSGAGRPVAVDVVITPPRKQPSTFGRFSSALELVRMPDWAQPIAWGLALIIPPISAVLWMSGGRRRAAVPGMAASFLTSGAMLGWLVFDYRRGRREAEFDDSREAFQVALVDRLKTVPVSHFSFSEIVDECGIERGMAEDVADAIYARVAANVVSDGIVTSEERRKLDSLSRSLEMTPDRADKIEDAARSERYQAAYKEAMADGVITRTEARELNELRESLGLQEATSPAVAGSIV